PPTWGTGATSTFKTIVILSEVRRQPNEVGRQPNEVGRQPNEVEGPRVPLRSAQATVPQVRGRSVAANLGQTDGHRTKTSSTPFWQKRYYDRNVRDEDEFMVKLRYLHRHPVARGLVKNPADWKWSSFR